MTPNARRAVATYRALVRQPGIALDAALAALPVETLGQVLAVSHADIDFGTRRQRATGFWMARHILAAIDAKTPRL